jgi:TRAP-type C4-dicarboxylate transport system substrate-binding protein
MNSEIFTSISRTAGMLIVLSLLGTGSAQAAKCLKIGSLAPNGSIYHRVLQEIAQAYKKSMGDDACAIVYTDALQGTEADTVRRMRIGQLDAGMLTVVGLATIDRSVTALQFMPMMFRTWDEVDHVREELRPDLEAKLASKNFVVLMWGEGGWVQFFMRNPITLPDEFKKVPVWTWDGNPAQVDIMKSMGFIPRALPIADIMTGLETGMFDVLPVPPLWALLGQFDRSAPHILPVNWVPIVGATVMMKPKFDRLPAHVQKAMMAAADVGAGKLRAHRAVQDAQSIGAMQKRGLKVLEVTPAIEQAWLDLADEAYPHIRGSMVPADTFDRVQKSLKQYRVQAN